MPFKRCYVPKKLIFLQKVLGTFLSIHLKKTSLNIIKMKCSEYYVNFTELDFKMSFETLALEALGKGDMTLTVTGKDDRFWQNLLSTQ